MIKGNRVSWILFLIAVTLAGVVGSAWLAYSFIQDTATALDVVPDTTVELSIPQSASAISPENINQLAELRRWGQGKILDVAFDPTRQYVALASTIGIYLYDARTLTQAHFIEMGSPVQHISFSPDGRLMALELAHKNEVQFWNVNSRKKVQSLKEEVSAVKELEFSSDSALLAVGTTDTVTVWDVSNGTLIHSLTSLEQVSISDVAFSPDGLILAAGSDSDDIVQLWQLSTGSSLPLLRTDQAQQSPDLNFNVSKSIAFSPDGELLASGTSDGKIRIWQVSESILLDTLEGEFSSVNSLKFSPSGEFLVSGLQNGYSQVWNIKEGVLILSLEGQEADVRQVNFSPDEKLVSSATKSGIISTWQVADGSLVNQIKDHATKSVLDVAFSPDGNAIVAGLGDGKVWLKALNDEKSNTLEQHDNVVDAVAFSPNGEYVATGVGGLISPGIWDDTVRIWHKSEQTLMHTLQGPREGISGCGIFRNTVIFSPDGSLLASAAYDHGVHLWQVDDGKLLHTFDEHALAVLDIDFSPDGKLLASASNDDTVKLWDISGRKLLLTLLGHLGGATSVAFSPDGAVLATGEATGLVRLWRVSNGELLHTFEVSKNSVSNLNFSPNGKILAAGAGGSFAIHLWNVETGTILQVLEGHGGRVNSVKFSTDGDLLLSGSEDGTVRLWGIATLDEDGRL